MIDTLNAWDHSLFWWVNSHHCMVSDWLLWTVSQAWSWPLVIGGAYLAVCKRLGWQCWWTLLIGIALCFLLGDRISVMCFKDTVMRLRPCHEMEGVRMFLTHCGGKYSFVSSHAANSAATAMFLSLMATVKMPHAKPLKCLPWLMAFWVLLIDYSRPYLGKHFPGDVLCGSILGIAIGSILFALYCRIAPRLQSRSTTTTSPR